MNDREFLPFDAHNLSIACAVPPNMPLPPNVPRRPCIFAGKCYKMLISFILFLYIHRRCSCQSTNWLTFITAIFPSVKCFIFLFNKLIVFCVGNTIG